jgi:hypothetical protein
MFQRSVAAMSVFASIGALVVCTAGPARADVPTLTALDLPVSVRESATVYGTVQLSGFVATDTSVTLSVDPANVVTVPQMATVPAGMDHATFGVQGVTPSNTPATVTATLGDDMRSDEIRVVTPTADPAISSVGLSTDTVVGGDPGSVTVTVTLEFDAPVGGEDVALASDKSSVTGPANVVVAADQHTATALFTAADVAADELATITGSLHGASQHAVLSVQSDVFAPAHVSALTVNGRFGAAGLTWTNPTDADWVGTKVCVAAAGTSPINPATCSHPSGVSISQAGPHATKATVAGLVAGHSYRVLVAPYDEQPNYRPSTRTLEGTLLTGHRSPAHGSLSPGDRVTLSTRLTRARGAKALAGRLVQLMQRAKGSTHWVVRTERTTGSDGRAHVRFAPKGTATYYWRFGGEGALLGARGPRQTVSLDGR